MAMNDTAVRINSEMENEMETKEENVILGVALHEEGRTSVSNPVMKIKNEIAVCGNEVENKIKIKEESVVSDSNLQSEDCFLPSDEMNVNSDIYEMAPKIEIKGEPYWEHTASVGVEWQVEGSSLSNLQMHSEIKDGAGDKLLAVESTRLNTEAASNACTATPYLFTAATLQEKDSSKCGKDNLEFAEASNVNAVSVSGTMETFCMEKMVHSQKSASPHEPNENEKLNNCSSNGKKLHMCKICKKSFLHQNYLKAHILLHEDKSPCRCDICRKSFTQMGHLKRHILIHEGKRPYKCEVCEKSFTQKTTLKRHVVIHEGKRPYKCEVCEKSFTEKGSLKNHYLIHEGKRPYKCDVCEKRFVQLGDLKMHFLIHDGKRTYKCDVCEKSFTHSKYLKIHSWIHEGKRPYKCDVCEKSFTHKTSLKSHILIHQGIRPYRCHICEKCFTRKRILKNHLLNHESKAM